MSTGNTEMMKTSRATDTPRGCWTSREQKAIEKHIQRSRVGGSPQTQSPKNTSRIDTPKQGSAKKEALRDVTNKGHAKLEKVDARGRARDLDGGGVSKGKSKSMSPHFSPTFSPRTSGIFNFKGLTSRSYRYS
ncbi:hypothetical protein BDV96DRAFT_689818 [Lophiotrema nucula]|uniref:Uncharacterized protein n=1 Tax=Lophiotrema nucula TaxID=690887 RepID=A0A6A5YYW7_9PLEO|nr:hypothetical protein BDV96DRAFT_689818 [Lophiotrema nucula]